MADTDADADADSDAEAYADADANNVTGGPSEPQEPLLTPDQEDMPRTSRSRENLALAPITWQQYFSDSPLPRDIGRPRDVATKVQKFKATMWLCEDYPLELQEQIMPILDLMASISSPHFAKLKDFVQMHLPSGFPVKIEIPLFHVLNARITFGNIFATESAVAGVEWLPAGARLACLLDDSCFSVGGAYRNTAAHPAQGSLDDEEGLLQYAIHQSLMEAGTHDDQVDVWEALRGARPASPAPPRLRDSPQELLTHEERQLQRAIEASLAALSIPPAKGEAPAPPPPEASPGFADPELLEALALSAQEQSARDHQLADEQRALDEVLRLSLLEK